MSRIHGRSKEGTAHDLLGLIIQDLVGHDVAHILSNPNKSASPLTGCGREGTLIHLVVDWFPPMEAEEGADVIGSACEAT